MSELSTKPYLVRALFDWCNDSGYTPYVAVAVGENVVVPQEYVKDGEIVLNVSPLATNRLTIGNEFLEFQARFGGVAREVRVPVEYIRAIYARETGQGMAFEVTPEPAKTLDTVKPADPKGRKTDKAKDPPPDDTPRPPTPGGRPKLQIVK